MHEYNSKQNSIFKDYLSGKLFNKLITEIKAIDANTFQFFKKLFPTLHKSRMNSQNFIHTNAVMTHQWV